MSKEIKQAEISELEKQQKKRNLITVTFTIFGVMAGYWLFSNTKAKKSKLYSYLIGGGIIAGAGYRALTMEKATRRKEAIIEKKATLEQGYFKPAPAPLDAQVAQTTIVDLGAPTTTTGTSTGKPDRPQPLNPNPTKPVMVYKN